MPAFEGICSIFNYFFKQVQYKYEYALHRWILLSALLMSAKVMTIVGTSVCLFLFTRRQFNWNEQTFSTYTTVETLIEVLGTTLMTIVGLKMLKLGDTLVALISTITCIVANVIIAFAPEGPEMSWILYLGTQKELPLQHAN